MLALALIPLTCWLCVLLALPRRPLLGHAVQELVYSRLLGRQQRLVLLALVATVLALLAFLATLPTPVAPGLRAHRPGSLVCTHPAVGTPTCSVLRADGWWNQEVLEDDGAWLATGTVAAPDEDARPTHNLTAHG
jgi:hypothetical protein